VDPTPDEIAVADEDVEGSRPDACWSVQEADWCAQLPAEVAALLAPPVIVSAESKPATSRPPSVCDNSASAAYGSRHAAPGDATTRFITPGLPRRLRNRRPAHPA
jgi:hypothetical protein